MPNQGQNVSFQYGTQQAYDNLQTKDSNTIYIITDNKKIYIGDQLYSNQELDVEALQKSLEIGLPRFVPNDMTYFDSNYFLEQGRTTWLLPGYKEIILNSTTRSQQYHFNSAFALKFLAYPNRITPTGGSSLGYSSDMASFTVVDSPIKNNDIVNSDVNFSGQPMIFENMIIKSPYTGRDSYPKICFENEVTFKNCKFMGCECWFVSYSNYSTITFENCEFTSNVLLNFYGRDISSGLLKGVFKNCYGNQGTIGIYNNYTDGFNSLNNTPTHYQVLPSKNLFNTNFYLQNCKDVRLDIRDSSNIELKNCSGSLYMSRVSNIYLNNCEINYFQGRGVDVKLSDTDLFKAQKRQQAVNQGGPFYFYVFEYGFSYEECGIDGNTCGHKRIERPFYSFGLNGFTSAITEHGFYTQSSNTHYNAMKINKNKYYIPLPNWDDSDASYYVQNGFTKVNVNGWNDTSLVPYENRNIIFDNCTLVDPGLSQANSRKILFIGCDNLAFRNCTLKGNFVIFHIRNLSIQNCNIKTTAGGFRLYKIDTSKISNSYFVRALTSTTSYPNELCTYCSADSALKTQETKVNKQVIGIVEFSNLKNVEFLNNSYKFNLPYQFNYPDYPNSTRNSYVKVDLHEIPQQGIIDILKNLPAPQIYVIPHSNCSFLTQQYESTAGTTRSVWIWDDNSDDPTTNYIHQATNKILFINPPFDDYYNAIGQSLSVKFDTDKLALINLNGERSPYGYNNTRQLSCSNPIDFKNLVILQQNSESGYNCYSPYDSTNSSLDNAVSPFSESQIFTLSNINPKELPYTLIEKPNIQTYLYMGKHKNLTTTYPFPVTCQAYCLNPLTIYADSDYQAALQNNLLLPDGLFAVTDNGALSFMDAAGNTFTIDGATSAAPTPVQSSGNSLISAVNMSAITRQATTGTSYQAGLIHEKSPLVFNTSNTILQDLTIEGNGGSFVLPTYEKQNVNITWESGSIDSSNGSLTTNTARIRTNAIPIPQTGTYVLKLHFSSPLVPGQTATYNSIVVTFDENNNFLESSYITNNYTWYEHSGVLAFNITNNTAKKIRIVIAPSDYSSNIYPSLLSSSELLLQTATTPTQYLTINVTNGTNSQNLVTNIQSLPNGDSVTLSDLNISIPTYTGDNIVTVGISPSPYVIAQY